MGIERMIKVYGITNCDTVKKARRWLESHDVSYQFHDFRKHGLPEALVSQWLATAPLTALINKRSSTWRNLSPLDQTSIDNALNLAPGANDVALRHVATLITRQPTLLKRPIIALDNRLLIGFNETEYTTLLTSLLEGS